MLRFSGLAALAIAASGAANASTFTLNDLNAFCVSGTCTQQTTGGGLEIANGLGAGAVYGVTDPSFQDGNGNTYAARVTVVATGGPSSANHSSINVSPLNAWIHYAFEFVESFDPNTGTFGADTMVENVQFVNIEDIDSNPGANFTDVAGVNLDVVGLGSALELAGFEANTPNAPMNPGFNFVRLSQGANNNWNDEGNVPANAAQALKDTVTASFGTPGMDLAGFEFIWGSTGSNRGGNVRGWDLTISADPVIPPIPVPAAFPLLLGAIAGLGFLRRRANAA